MTIPTPQEKINAYYDHNFQNYNRLMNENEPKNARQILKDNMDLDGKILEVASGSGRNFEEFRPYAAIEINPNMINLASKLRTNVQIIRGDASELPFLDNSFDSAILIYAISAIPDKEGLAKEVKRVVEEGGKIGILDFNYISQPSYVAGAIPFNMGDIIANEFDLSVSLSKEFPKAISLPHAVYILQNK